MTARSWIQKNKGRWRQKVIETYLASPGLCLVAALMIVDVIGTTVGMMTDHTIITICRHGWNPSNSVYRLVSTRYRLPSSFEKHAPGLVFSRLLIL